MSKRQEFFSGFVFTAINRYSTLFVGILVSMILSRILSPEDFGLMALTSVAMTFFSLLSNIGIGPAIIQKDLTHAEHCHIYSFSIFLGLLIALLFLCLAYPIALFYDDTRLVSLFACLSITIILGCMGSVPASLAAKNKQFKFIAKVGIVSSIISGTVSVGCALCGLGVYSLVTSGILGSFISFLMYCHKHPVSFILKMDFAPVKKIMSYSSYIFLFNFINYFSRNLDKILMGKYLGIEPLGYYDKSYNLMTMPLQQVSHVITPVIQPILADKQDDTPYIRDVYFRFIKMVSYISFPLSVFLYYCAYEIILLFYGNQWGGAISPFQILSLTVSLQMLNSFAGTFYMVTNNSKLFFISGCWCAVFMLTGISIPLIFYGTIESVAWGFLIAQFFNTCQNLYFMLQALHCSVIYYFRSIWKSMLIALGLALVLLPFMCFTISDSLAISLALKCSVSFIAVFAMVQIAGDYNMIHLSRAIINRKKIQ